MASLLESKIRKLIGAGFKGKLLKGTLRRLTSTGLDEKGDETGITTKDYKFEGIRDNFDKRYAQQAGIPETDVRILIIADSIAVVPRAGDKIELRGAWNEVRRVLAIDPADASYTLQAFEVEAP